MMRSWWERFWFAPAPAINLAAARLVFSIHSLWMLGSLDLPAISGVPEVFWADVTRVESEVRAFLHNGMQPVIGRLQASRVSCAQAHDKFLQQYWDQLRAHAQAHWVEERGVDQVLDTMAQRYDPDILRRQRDVMHNPFTSER